MAGDGYTVGAEASVEVTVNGNDVAGLTLTDAAGLETDETGTTDTFRVALSSEPTADVTVDVASNDAGEGTVAPALLTFNAGNWDQPQPITVTGVNDELPDGDQQYAVRFDLSNDQICRWRHI